MTEDRSVSLVIELFSALPRQGPGSPASTQRALRMVPTLPAKAKILDVGCGSGAQTFALAQATPAHIVAVDVLPTMVKRLNARAAELDCDRWVKAQVGDMTKLSFPDSSFDLIWSEGAIYNMGFEVGLSAWRRLLKAGGHVAVTEVSWLRDDVPAACRAFWQRYYPAITDVATNLEAVQRAGYEEVGHFALPAACWWDDFYAPLQERLPIFRAAHPDDPVASKVAAEAEEEIAMWRQFSDVYGYVFYVARRA